MDSEEQLISAIDAVLAAAAEDCLFLVITPDNLDQIEVVAPPRMAERLLARIGQQVAETCAAGRMLVRRGGRQFLVLLPGVAPAEVRDLVGRLARTVPLCRIEMNGNHYGVTAHVATVSAALASPRTAERVLQLADAAAILSRSRISGPGTTFLGGDSELAAVELSARHLLDLPAALDQGRIHLCAQEIVSLVPDPEGRREYEVLMQLVDRTGRLHPPGTFINRAEKSGLIEMLDRSVIRTALVGHAALLHRAAHVCLSLNISGRSLSSPDLWPFLRGVLDESGIDPARVQFEITETAAILDLPLAQRNVAAIRAAGCRVALDDFGAGLSGFAYLNSFALDGIKVDGALIPNLTDPDSVETAIVSALIQLGRRLGLQVVAEHVSSEETLGVLRAMGVGKVQGFLLGWPMNLGQVLEAEARSV